MKDTKTEFRFFTVPEWKKEEEYLREQHKRGWEFVKVNSIGFYHFKKCEPKDVIYQLDYNPDSVTQKMSTFKCFVIAGGSICKTMLVTVISAKQPLRWTERKKKFSVMMPPDWI